MKCLAKCLYRNPQTHDCLKSPVEDTTVACYCTVLVSTDDRQLAEQTEEEHDSDSD